MSQLGSYADPKFGVEMKFETDLSASLASTVAATELFRYRMKKAGTINDIYARIKTGGTDAVRKIIVGTCAANGTMTAIGTATLGTQANSTTKALGISGNFAANEDVVFQHLGTGAEPWNLSFGVFYQERFTNA